MNYFFIVNAYPTKEDPTYAFIKPFVCAIADMGNHCTVIAPQSVSRAFNKKKKVRPVIWQDKTDKGNSVDIIQPKYISFSNVKINGSAISSTLRDRAISKGFRLSKTQPDIIYAHFWECGLPAVKMGEKYNCKAVVASGESRIKVYDYYAKKRVQECVQKIDGLICVSTKNLDESRSLGLVREGLKTIILPNAYNPEEFYKIPKVQARKAFNLSEDDYIGIFVGAFIHRKGPDRVVEAVEKIEGVKMIFVGSGSELPESDKTIFSGRLSHDEIVQYLNAADFFVLPTLAEGCCNAIIEAMACGLPIISSNLAFNDDILDDECSIRIDPNSTEDIVAAIEKLKDKDTRNRMANNSYKKALGWTIDNRAGAIVSFMKSCQEQI